MMWIIREPYYSMTVGQSYRYVSGISSSGTVFTSTALIDAKIFRDHPPFQILHSLNHGGRQWEVHELTDDEILDLATRSVE